MKNYFTKFKKTIALVATIVLGAIAFMPSASALVDTPWGPARTTFTWEDPAPYATFNSITNNPQLGDERNFVRIREVADGSKFGDSVILEMGKTYEVYIYYHNNADGHEVGKTAIGIADGASVKSSFPATVKKGKKATVSATIFAADTDPLAVWDGAYMVPSRDLYLRYVPGSATIHNGGTTNGSVLPSNLFTEGGTYLGYNKLIGNLPGCAEYSGYITYTLVAEKTSATLEKKVSLDGTTWADTVNAKPGDYVTYRVKFENTGNTNLTNVIFKVVHDNGLTLRTGSTKIFNLANQNGKQIDDIIDISGYNTGDLAAGALVQVIYQAQVSTDKTYCKKTLKNTITASYNSNQNQKDSANVVVVCEEDPTPAETCETNPNLPECKKDCTTNPELPECQEEETCKTNPNLPGCQEIPSTGPVEIVLASVVAAGILGGGLYLYKTRKTLKSVESAVKGEDKGKEK